MKPRHLRSLFNYAPDDGAPAGGGNDPAAPNAPTNLEARIAALEAENAALKKQKETPPPDDDQISLSDKVKKERESKQKKDSDTRSLEHALKFNLMSADFLKSNESILPSEISDIFAAAEREKYDSATEKANATKAGIIQTFFGVQSNFDLLTPSHKTMIADYLKLTKNGKEQKAAEVFENIFEPTLEMVKRIKKAEELAKSRNGGYPEGSEKDRAYKERMIKLSRQHYLGEKHGS